MARFSLQSFRQKYGRYITVGLIVFIVGLIYHFPITRLSPLILQTIEKNSGYRIQATHISIVMPIGLEMENVRVQGPDIGNVPVDHKFESIRLYPSVMSLLTYVSKKSLGLRFKADRGNERWSGVVAYGPKYTDVSISGKHLDYSIIIPLDEYNAMLANQTLTISSKLALDFSFEGPSAEIQSGDLTNASGSFELTSKDTSLENMLVGKLDFTDTLIQAQLDKGLLELPDVHMLGDKLELDIEGALKLKKSLQASTITKADIRLFVDPSLTQLASMVEMLGNMNKVQVTNSTMNFRISGPVNNVSSWRVTNL